MTKNSYLIYLFLLTLSFTARVEARSKYRLRRPRIDRSDKIMNLQRIDDKQFSFGYSVGLNSFSYKISQKTNSKRIDTETSPGYYACAHVSYKLSEYIDIRTGLGFIQTNRTIKYPELSGKDAERKKESNFIVLPVYLKLHTKRDVNLRPYLLGGFSVTRDLTSEENNDKDNFREIFRTKTMAYQVQVGVGIDFYFLDFKMSPSIIGVFSLSDELVADKTSPSQWTDDIERLQTQGVIFSLTFQ